MYYVDLTAIKLFSCRFKLFYNYAFHVGLGLNVNSRMSTTDMNFYFMGFGCLGVNNFKP